MSYDLYFMKEHRGKTPMEYCDDLRTGMAKTDDASAINIHEVSDSLLELGIGLHLHAHRVASEGEIESIELTIVQPARVQMRVLITELAVTLTIPFWVQTSGSIAELRQRWDALLPRMARLTLTGYDPQHMEVISLDTFNTMVSALADTAPAPAVVEKKPWWKFWSN